MAPMIKAGHFIILALVALLPAIALADVIGPVRVIDGDTLEVAGQRVRLCTASTRRNWPKRVGTRTGSIPAAG